ncbi:hypothetical protein [Citrobacter meridianamericanus]|uniref:hypothetical protein n=1 Tax=Citrobacter meridianamericanus TaxID=2894201 RepID=UPI0039BE466B
MKTPINMLEDITAEICESASLLETIYKNSNENPETDSAIRCLGRSLQNTIEKTNDYIKEIMEQNNVSTKTNDSYLEICDDVLDGIINAAKTKEVAHQMLEGCFSNDDSDKPECILSAVIFDYAIKTHDILKRIDSKLN